MLQWAALGAALCPPADAGVLAEAGVLGSLRVEIRPAAAASDGAAWRVDGGEWLAPDDVASGLAPGYHQLEFFRPTGWSVPETQHIVIVGGGLQSLPVDVQRLPAYHFQAVPPQTARPGRTLRFRVRSPDPPCVAGTSRLDLCAEPRPVGSLGYDPETGEVAYTPAPEDRAGFTLTLRAWTAAGPIEGQAWIRPNGESVSEEEGARGLACALASLGRLFPAGLAPAEITRCDGAGACP